MSLPVSSYEELLRTVRGLTLEARQVQSIATPLLATLQADASYRGRVGGSGCCGATTSATSTAAALDDRTETPPLLPSKSPPHDTAVSKNDEGSINSFGSSATERPNVKHKISKEDDSVRLKCSKSKTYKELTMDSTNSNNDAKTHTSSLESYSARVTTEHDPYEEVNEETSNRGHLSNLYHGTWPVERGLWQSVPTSLPQPHQDMTSVMSFASSAGSTGPFDQALFSTNNSEGEPSLKHSSISSTQEAQQLGAKVDIVYGLLSMLGSQENADMGHTLLALSSSPESCLAMRQSGCIPLLVQLVHSECDSRTRQQATQALHNLVQAQPDDRLRRRESRVLRLLEQIRVYCESAASQVPVEETSTKSSDKDTDKHPGQIIANLMKLSFDEAHRIAICQLGGLQTIAQLIQVDHIVHGSECEDTQCITLRRYAGMALTNLTFGDGNNKALLCSLRDFMTALVKQLYSTNEDLKQVTASVLRNLSWRADSSSKQILREVGAVTGLAQAAMSSRKESTLKSVLSALWNLSAHCSINKADICGVEGLLAFIVTMLGYKSPSKTLAIIENAGGILRNISSHIAVRDDYRLILREHNCLQVLLHQLRSPSLTVVSNACGTLWNLSAKCPVDQKALWDMGAVPMLRSLTHSKHKMISMGSSAALKNLLSARPSGGSLTRLDSTAKALGLSTLPTLGARKQRALEQELDKNLSETCDNIEPSLSPSTSTNDKFNFTPTEAQLTKLLSSQSYTQGCRQKADIALSESRESVTSTHSDSVYERVVRSLPKRNESPSNSVKTDVEYSGKNINSALFFGTKLSQSDSIAHCSVSGSGVSDQKFVKRYENSHSEQKPLNFNIWSSKNTQYTSKYSSRTPHTGTAYIPLRNKYSDCVPEDEQNGTDQTVDYSQKYTEVKLSDPEHTALNNNSAVCKNSQTPPNKTKNPNSSTNSKTKVEVAYGNYAITDLDQPTDYSLRYAEDGADSEMIPCANKEKMFNHVSEFPHEDTVKTYCTEGTPYETPFNFSTSTSMNDLRMESTVSNKIDNDRQKVSNQTKSKDSEIRHSDEKDKCSAEDVSKIGTEENRVHSSGNKYTQNFKSECSSGLTSPEKPVNYCEEGTPGCFSRVSSLSSLNSVNIDTPDKKNSLKNKKSLSLTPEKDNLPQNTSISGIETPKLKIREEGSKDRECKVVTFGASVDYAEETPLMFSRSSSLASLDSVEQHSIHDDRSSVISDFSRRTSGIVSPSELPDSPTQTVPPTPVRPLTNPNIHSCKNLQPVSNIPSTSIKRSVFEDDTSAFKDENTPIEFSRATSLSSLTIDDEVKITSDSLNKEIPGIIPIQQFQQTHNNEKYNSTSEIHLHASSSTMITISKSNIPSTSQRNDKEQIVNGSLNVFEKPSNTNIELLADATKVYHTEDTPAVLSHAGSFSNLSELSMLIDNESNEISRVSNQVETSDCNKSVQNTIHSLLENNDKNTDTALKIEKSSSSKYDEKDKNSTEQENLEMEIVNSLKDLSINTSHITQDTKLINATSTSQTQQKDETFQQKYPLVINCESNELKLSESSIIESNDLLSPSLQQDIEGQCQSNLHSNSNEDNFNLSDIGSNTSADEQILQQCIQAGIDKATGNGSVTQVTLPFLKESNILDTLSNTDTDIEKQYSEEVIDLSDESGNTSADERLLQQCIQAGMDRVTSTAHTIIALPKKSEKKSHINKRGENGELSDDSYSSSDERLLQECIKVGMARVAASSSIETNKVINDKGKQKMSGVNELKNPTLYSGIPQYKSSSQPKSTKQSSIPRFGFTKKLQTSKYSQQAESKDNCSELKLDIQDNLSKKGSCELKQSVLLKKCSSAGDESGSTNLNQDLEFSDDGSINSTEERLLMDCIKLGIERATKSSTSESKEEKLEFSDDSNTSADERLLQECIQFGMERVTKGSADARLIHGEDDDNASITSADERLLTECINLGIQAVTGERPQISTSLLKQPNRKIEPCINSNSKKMDKKGKLKYSPNNESSHCDTSFGKGHLKQSSKQKGTSERLTKSAPLPISVNQVHNVSTMSLDSTTSLNDSEKALLDECIRVGMARTTGQPISEIKLTRSRDNKSTIRPENRKPIGAERDIHQSHNSIQSSTNTNYNQNSIQTLAHSSGSRYHSELNVTSHETHQQDHALKEQNYSPYLSTEQKANFSEDQYCYQHPAFRESSFTMRVPTYRDIRLKHSVASRENNPTSHHCDNQERSNLSSSHMSRQEYYNTRVPAFANQEKEQPELKPVQVPHNSSKNVQAPPVTVSTASIKDVSTTHNTIQVTGVESVKRYVANENLEQTERDTLILSRNIYEKSPNESIRPIENSWIGETKSGCDKKPRGFINCNGETANMLNDSPSIENCNSSIVQSNQTSNLSEYVTCGEENTLVDATSQDCNDSMSDDGSLECSEELKFDYCKPRDPDSMLASVDRLTAELVSQATHLHADRLMKQSTQETWNDSSSTNDLTFPSISASAPMIVSLKSDTDNEFASAMPNFPEENVLSNNGCVSIESTEAICPEVCIEKDETLEDLTNPSSLDTNQSTMTDSTIIAQEAYKLAAVVCQEIEMAQSTTSFSSIDLDNVKPPSNMGSLISLTSTSGQWESTELGQERPASFSLRNAIKMGSKKKVPSDIMVRMALSNSSNHADSFELNINGSSSASSMNLDHVKPPSLFNDISDMENSMISVCSIMSEVAESSNVTKTDFIPNGLVTTDIFDVDSKNNHLVLNTKEPLSLNNFMACSINGHSYSDIDNINPPSYLNDMSDTTDISFNEHRTDTVGDVSTDAFEDCLTHVVDTTLKNETDITDYSDANSITPIQSDYATSSAESTPKKINHVNKRLTPKQRRQLTKERFKTYTVAAEMVIKEEERKRQYECSQSSDHIQLTEPVIVHNTVENEETRVEQTDTVEGQLCVKNKITPKQRRQEDRSRFQTRVLDIATFGQIESQKSNCESLPNMEIENTSLINQSTSVGNSGEVKKTLKQKRLENKDRFRTRTLTEGSTTPPASLPNVDTFVQNKFANTDELHTMLEQEANVVLNTLNENADDFLDCETLSLVSNEDESEHNSMNSVNFRTYHKSWGFNGKCPQVSNGYLKTEESCHQNIDAVASRQNISSTDRKVINQIEGAYSNNDRELSNNEAEVSDIKSKPKIIKPNQHDSKENIAEVNIGAEQVKAVRGKRKPLYSSSCVKTSISAKVAPKNKIITSNLVTNVSAAMKSTLALKKPSVYKTQFTKSVSNKSNQNPSIQAPKRVGSNINLKANVKVGVPPKKTLNVTKTTSGVQSNSIPVKTIERQNTFTKDDQNDITKSPLKTKIPLPSTSGGKTGTNLSKIPSSVNIKPKKTPVKVPPATNFIKKPLSKSSSVELSSRSKYSPVLNRTGMLLSRNPSTDNVRKQNLNQTAHIRNSSSNYSLKNSKSGTSSPKRALPFTQRSYSNSSIQSTSSSKKTPVLNSAQKEVTSKIASLWKKVEQTRNQPKKKDTRVWISNHKEVEANENKSTTACELPPQEPQRLIRSSTFESVPKNDTDPNVANRELPDISKTNRCTYNFESAEYVNTHLADIASGVEITSRFNIPQTITNGTATVVLRRRKQTTSIEEITDRISNRESCIQNSIVNGVSESVVDLDMDENYYQQQTQILSEATLTTV